MMPSTRPRTTFRPNNALSVRATSPRNRWCGLRSIGSGMWCRRVARNGDQGVVRRGPATAVGTLSRGPVPWPVVVIDRCAPLVAVAGWCCSVLDWQTSLMDRYWVSLGRNWSEGAVCVVCGGPGRWGGRCRVTRRSVRCQGFLVQRIHPIDLPDRLLAG